MFICCVYLRYRINYFSLSTMYVYKCNVGNIFRDFTLLFTIYQQHFIWNRFPLSKTILSRNKIGLLRKQVIFLSVPLENFLLIYTEASPLLYRVAKCIYIHGPHALFRRRGLNALSNQNIISGLGSSLPQQLKDYPIWSPEELITGKPLIKTKTTSKLITKY